MTQPKVAEDVALVEFARMCDANRIDHDVSKLDEDDAKEFEEIRGKLVADICRGALVVDTSGRPVYSPEIGKPLTFNAATGATIIALETHGKDKQISNMVAAMADMTGTSKGEFSRLGARDFQAVSRIAKLFLSDR